MSRAMVFTCHCGQQLYVTASPTPIEGTTRSVEQVESIVPDAGGVVKQCESNVPAGREPWAEFKDWFVPYLGLMREQAKGLSDNTVGRIRANTCEAIYDQMLRIEARRRTQDA